MLKKFWISTLFALTLFVSVPAVHAATSILPSAGADGASCDPTDAIFVEAFNEVANTMDFKTYVADNGIDKFGEFLGCALKMGYIRFWMIPYFVIFALQFILELAGLLAVLMVVVGGYYYVIGGVTDDKEKGKTIITHALGGLALVLTSWFIVNLVLVALTS